MDSRFAVPIPCSKSWGELTGDGRKRYCHACEKYVHAFDAYTPEELDRLWRESDGRLCGMIGGQSEAAPRSRRAVLTGAFLTVISPLMAQTGRIRMRVVDIAGAVIPNAEVLLLGDKDQTVRRMLTDSVGEAVWSDLPIGSNRFVINLQGFRKKPVTVSVRNGAPQDVRVQLDVGELLGEVVEVVPHKASNEKRKLR